MKLKNLILITLTINLFTTCRKADVEGNTREVYVAGHETIDGRLYSAKVWKNGVATNLVGTSLSTYVYSIYVSGSGVYVAGVEFSSKKEMAKVWKNWVPTDLSDGSQTALTTSICVQGYDIYMSGYENNEKRM